MLFSDESRVTLSTQWSKMVAANAVGKLYAPGTVVTRWSFGGCDVAVRAGVSSQYRSALNLVNGTVTSWYYLNNIINPAMVPLHKQNTPDFILINNNAPAHQGRIIREWLLWLGYPQVSCTFSGPESHRKPMGSSILCGRVEEQLYFIK